MAAEVTRNRSGFWQRLKRVNRLFLSTAVVPTALVTFYFGAVVSDIYVPESCFVARSPQWQNQSGSLSALLQGTGFSRAQDDTYPVIDYVEPYDTLGELDRDNYILDAYGNRGDILSRFLRQLDDNLEALWKYYNKRVVAVEFGSTSTIIMLQVRSFTSQDMIKISKSLLKLSEHLINRMSECTAGDMVQFVCGEVDAAAVKTKDATAALVTYRKSNIVFDPDRQSTLQL